MTGCEECGRIFYEGHAPGCVAVKRDAEEAERLRLKFYGLTDAALDAAHEAARIDASNIQKKLDESWAWVRDARNETERRRAAHVKRAGGGT